MTKLLDEGCSIDTRDYAGRTPLICAFDISEWQAAELLIERGANLIIPFHWAAGNYRSHVAQILISKGVDVNVKDTEGDTPLYIATISNDLHCVDLLISEGAEVDAKNRYGYTSLHAAASKGHVDILAYLIYAGADVNAKSDQNVTPLWWAAKEGNLESIKFLISNGADVHAKDNDSNVPLGVADTDEKKHILYLCRIGIPLTVPCSGESFP
jgi:ankyrin repeat protein